MRLPRTTADVPPSIANEYSKAPRGQAIAEATGDGYTNTARMQRGIKTGKGQFGLPRSKKPKTNTVKM